MVQVAPYYRLSGRPPVPLLRGTVVAYLAGDPFYYRIQPDKRNGQQGPDVHAKTPSATASSRLRGTTEWYKLHRITDSPADEAAGPEQARRRYSPGTVVAYLAGDPFYYRIQPDKRNGQQPPDVHAENPLRGRILPLRRRVAYVLDEHSGPSNAPGLVTIVGIWGFWGPMREQLAAKFGGDWFS